MRKNPESKAGTWGWVGLGAYVAAWDYWAPETLTNAFLRGREHRVGKFVVAAAAGYVAAHLYDRLPENLDAFDYIAKKIGEIDGK